MKNYLIGWRKWETEFNGDKIEMEISPLKRKEFLKLLPLMDRYNEAVIIQDSDRMKSISDMTEVIEDVEPILVDKVRNISGFLVDDAPPKSISDLFGFPVFMPLIMDLVIKIMSISRLENAEEKNFEGQSMKLQ